MTPLDAAIRAMVDAYCVHIVGLRVEDMPANAEITKADKEACAAALRAFIDNPHLGISWECRETLRAHLGEG